MRHILPVFTKKANKDIKCGKNFFPKENERERVKKERLPFFGNSFIFNNAPSALNKEKLREKEV